LFGTGILEVVHERAYLTHGMAGALPRIPKWVLEKILFKYWQLSNCPPVLMCP